MAGFSTLIINKTSPDAKNNPGKAGHFEGIPYVYTSVHASRPDKFIPRSLNKISGYVGEFALLKKKRKTIQAAILYTSSFFELVYYRLLSAVFRFKLVIQYVEFRSSIHARKGFFTALNDRLFDNYCHRFCDGIIVISEFLKDHVRSKTDKIQVVKIPAINDFGAKTSMPSVKRQPYLMYCGTIEYLEVIKFILEVFAGLKLQKGYHGRLLLIISGSNVKNWEALRSILDREDYQDLVEIRSNIKHSELLSFYDGADLLMIPLRDSIQDRARFPHKIGEYTASKRPILSTNVGEMRSYFKNGISAILADKYSVDDYIDTLSRYLVSDELTSIGLSGYQVGMENFHYANYEDVLKGLVNSKPK